MLPAVPGLQAIPAEQLIARRLHEPLPFHDPATLRLVDRRLRVRLEHRALRLLELQDERVDSCPGPSSGRPTRGSPRCPPRRPCGRCGRTGIARPRTSVGAGSRGTDEGTMDYLHVPGTLITIQQLLDGDEQRRCAHEPDLPVDVLEVPFEGPQMVPAQRLLNLAITSFEALASARAASFATVPRRAAARTRPRDAPLGELLHRLPIGADRPCDRRLALVGGQAECPSRRSRSSPRAARRPTRRGPGASRRNRSGRRSAIRSGVSKRPKFNRWASPHSCARSPEVAVPARSAAMIAAPPR